MTTEERFWDTVVMGYGGESKRGGECWEWGLATIGDQYPYGIFYLRWDRKENKSILMLAHRFAWEAVNGPIPKGMDVCHHCDNPKCVRPEHLFVGPREDNMQDCARKGRQPNVKLSKEDIAPIRLMHGEGWNFTEIARHYGVNRSTISRIVKRSVWKHVAALAIFINCSCARTDIYYPPDGKSVVVDDRGRPHRAHNRAVVLNGTDSLGSTQVDVTRDGVRFANAGGLDNTTATGMGYRTIRYGIAAAAWTAGAAVVASQAASAYNANQAASSSSNVAASNAAASTAATKAATATQLQKIQAVQALKAAEAAKALPAAGSTINAITPATVIPTP